MQVGWIIDVDHIADETAKSPSNCNAKGLMGPRAYNGDGTDCIYHFRMYDDDGELYYSGRCNTPDDFAPLDNFGKGNAGCTEIHYQNDQGNWIML